MRWPVILVAILSRRVVFYRTTLAEKRSHSMNELYAIFVIFAAIVLPMPTAGASDSGIEQNHQ